MPYGTQISANKRKPSFMVGTAFFGKRGFECKERVQFRRCKAIIEKFFYLRTANKDAK